MNIIIAGDGEVGLHLAQELANENHDITIIDQHEEMLKMVESHTDLMTIMGNPTSIPVLQNANINKADLLISVVHNENINLITAMLGKQLGAKRTIARVNNLENLSKENIQIFKNLGIDSLVCPEEIAAQEIIGLLKQTAATEIFDFSDGKLSLFLIKLDENDPVINKTLNQIAEEYPHQNIISVAIHRNSETIIPKGDNMLKVNDLSYVITKPEGVNELLMLSGKKHIEIHNVMIIGGGRDGRTTSKKHEKNSD